MKKIISTCIALMVSAACSISAFAMEVPTNTTIQDLNGVRQYIKIYTVAPDTDPQSLIDDVFEYDGYTYTYSSMTKEERSYLEAIDVMLELSGCDPSFFSSERLESPFLLRFTGSGEELSYLFTVAWLDTPERIRATSRMKGERIIWISDRRDSRGIALPHHHIFAVCQEDGTHRFFGSHEPEKI